MKKIVSLSLAFAMAASVAVAGGVKDEKQQQQLNTVPVAPVSSSMPGNMSPLALLLLLGGGTAVIVGIAGAGGES